MLLQDRQIWSTFQTALKQNDAVNQKVCEGSLRLRLQFCRELMYGNWESCEIHCWCALSRQIFPATQLDCQICVIVASTPMTLGANICATTQISNLPSKYRHNSIFPLHFFFRTIPLRLTANSLNLTGRKRKGHPNFTLAYKIWMFYCTCCMALLIASSSLMTFSAVCSRTTNQHDIALMLCPFP